MTTPTFNGRQDRIQRPGDTPMSGVKQHKMVGWYDPGQLLWTGINIVISSALGTRSDVRWMETAIEESGIIEYDETTRTEQFWFDYMADTGDGWNSTFKMARLVGKESVTIAHEGEQFDLTRGKFLILGGDEVYPCASRLLYRERLVNPFWYACPRKSPDPKYDKADLYAIPGNHDWYDGLVSFMRQFQQKRDIGIWRTKQSRSYFALKLPHNWWLWGVDTQLESDIDWPQVQFFKTAALEMEEDDNLIVCTAEPYWIYAHLDKPKALDNNLLFLLGEKVLGQSKANVYLSLAGDLHHYRRHQDECDPNRQRIVSGGGGAFLHPTHDCSLVAPIKVKEGPRVERNSGLGSSVDAFRPQSNPSATAHQQDGPQQSANTCSACDRHCPTTTTSYCGPVSEESTGTSPAYDRNAFEHTYNLKTQFPNYDCSRRLAKRNRWFFVQNPRFGLVTAIVYSIAGAVLLDYAHFRPVMGHPSFLVITLALVASFGICAFFCDGRRGPWFRAIWGGLVHGGIHFAAAVAFILGLYAASTYCSVIWRNILIFLGIPIGGYFLGSFILGLYLLVSLNWFQVNQNEAFSALRIEDYKNFIRLCIEKDGSLTIYPIGVPSLKEDPILIERPIHIVPDHRPSTGRKAQRKPDHKGE